MFLVTKNRKTVIKINKDTNFTLEIILEEKGKDYETYGLGLYVKNPNPWSIYLGDFKCKSEQEAELLLIYITTELEDDCIMNMNVVLEQKLESLLEGIRETIRKM